MNLLIKNIKGLSVFILCCMLFVPCTVNADTQVKPQIKTIGSDRIDWKTAIPLSLGDKVNRYFKDEYEEEKIQYVTTDLNMRPFPNTNSEVIKILEPNTEVVTIADYRGWTKIKVEDKNYEDDGGKYDYYYLWNEYLSDEKVEVKSKNEQSNSAVSTGNYLGNFKLTAYCNCSTCCGKWAGGATASGTTPTADRTVAMGDIPFGTQLVINGHVYTVEDRGTPYGHVDIYFNSHEEALQFGLQYADVYLVS